MQFRKDVTIAFTFVSCIFGGGLSSGKEVATFLENSSILSIVLCGMSVGLLALPFLILANRNNGDMQKALFGKHEDIGIVIVKIINFIFLSAMLSGTEALLLECFNFRGGSLTLSAVILILSSLGDRFIKTSCFISIPLTITLLLFLTLRFHYPISGNVTVLRPIIYAAMNTFCASVFTSKFVSSLKREDLVFIAVLIGVTVSCLLILIKSITVNNGADNIPLYSVAKDTDFAIFSALIIFIAMLTSGLSSLKLASSSKPYSPYLILALALYLSTFGFNKILNYVYPLIGLTGILFTLLAVGKVVYPKVKIKKDKDCT